MPPSLNERALSGTIKSSSRVGGLSVFLGAIRLMTQDPGQTDLFGAEAFSASSARTADARAHDAVVALVRAAEAAGSAVNYKGFNAFYSAEFEATDKRIKDSIP